MILSEFCRMEQKKGKKSSTIYIVYLHLIDFCIHCVQNQRKSDTDEAIDADML